jgi:hypothetical protein
VGALVVSTAAAAAVVEVVAEVVAEVVVVVISSPETAAIEYKYNHKKSHRNDNL